MILAVLLNDEKPTEVFGSTDGDFVTTSEEKQKQLLPL